MQLTVEKSDGSVDVYRHTKVLGTIATALSESDTYQPQIAEELAEAVTTYLRHEYGTGRISFDEIYSMIQAVLTDTGHEPAALSLHDHRVLRQMKRGRIEVTTYHQHPTDQEGRNTSLYGKFPDGQRTAQPWNKSVIVSDLVEVSGVEYDLARSVAGAVEEMVLRMDCRSLSSTLMRELVINELRTLREAELALAEQVTPVEEEESTVASAY